MITIKSKEEIELLREAGYIVYETHQYLKQFIKPGITTKELDNLAEKFIKSKNAYPSFKNYNGYPGSICTSVNQEVVHGIPGGYKLKNGDIISIDIGACYKGFHGDSAWSYAVGNIDKEKNYLLEHTEKALYEGLKEVKVGNRIGDIGNAVETYAKAHHLGVVKELVGHGVGSKLHEDPDIPNYGKKNTGPLIKEGMVLAIEPMLTLHSPDIVMLDDDWTIETEDFSPSAHFEHTVAVCKDGIKILTGE
ncbi:MAG TPA: type I methionyl aminopeptidase [Bacilli bacterium]|nr:type I methionyl aminopeptidase [Bacilli bacterium]